MYRSLEKNCDGFHLYVFAFDNNCYRFLKDNANEYPNITAISLQEFEDPALLGVKRSRSAAEYCWTATPSTILYCLRQFQLEHCTYIDADIYFYSDPAVLLNEMGEKPVLISEHRYTKAYDQSDYSGIYCVQFICFKNNAAGLETLQWWRNRCIEWCYARLEDGKFGDQKYLDDWTTRFPQVHVLQHPGGGVAPWNVQQYLFNGPQEFTEISSGKKYPLVFFHYHGLKFYMDNKVSLCGPLYDLLPSVGKTLYFPYLSQLLLTGENIRKKGMIGNITGAVAVSPSAFGVFLQFLKGLAIQIKKGKVSPLRLKIYNFKRHYHFYRTDQFN
jgi:hypothetical protein